MTGQTEGNQRPRPEPTGEAGGLLPVHRASSREPGVLGRWMSQWADALEGVHQDLGSVTAGLGGATSVGREQLRGWLVVDWMIRAVAPRWLRAAGLEDHAWELRRLGPIGSTQALRRVGPVVRDAELVASEAHLESWNVLATRVRPQSEDTDRAQRWQAVIDGTRTALRTVWTVIDPAVAATGYPTEDGPPAWSAAVATIQAAAGVLAWEAAATLTQTPAVWAVPPAEVQALAYCAARAALAGADAATAGSMGELIALMLTLPDTQGEPS